ncbi:hypothetical protein [Paramesorhizobium deserti]|nr:hypothetical protein [Paramesorhizobium deserti]
MPQTNAGSSLQAGRDITINAGHDAILQAAEVAGATATTNVNGVQRTSYTLGNVRVWAEDGGKTIITILRIGSQ